MLADALGARVLLAVVGIVNIAIISRAAGVETYGIYATAMAFSTLLAVIADIGSSAVMVREASGEHDVRPLIQAYVYVRLVSAAVCGVVGVVAILLLFPDAAVQAGLLALLTLVLFGPSLLVPLDQVQGDMGRFRTAARYQAAVNLLATIGVVVVVPHPNASALVVTNIAAGIVSTGYAAGQLSSILGARLGRPDWRVVSSMLRSVTLIGIGGAINTLYSRIDSVLLLRYGGAADAGQYAAAYRFIDQGAMVPVAILAPVAPAMAREIDRRGSVSAVLDQALMKIEGLAGVGLSWVTIGVAPFATATLLGGDFTDAAALATLLAIYQSWSVVAYIATTKTFQAHRERAYIAVTAAGLVCNVVANLVAIPQYGAFGAVGATLVTELLTVAGYCWIGRDVSPNNHISVALTTAAAAGMAAGAALVAAQEPLPAQIAVGVVLAAAGAGLLLRAARALSATL